MSVTGQPGFGPDLDTVVTKFYGGTVDEAQPCFRLNMPGVAEGHCLLWNDPKLGEVNAPWRKLLSFYCVASTGTVQKVRNFEVNFTDNANDFYLHREGYSIHAGVTGAIFTGAIGKSGVAHSDGPPIIVSIGLPDIWLPPGCPIALGLGNFDNGDRMTEAHLIVQEAGPILQNYGETPPVYVPGPPALT